MPALRSSVLIVGHPNSTAVEFGADFSKNFTDAKLALSEFAYPVIVLPSSMATAKGALELLESANHSSPLSQRVIIQNDTSAEDLRSFINKGSVFRVLQSFDDSKFELTIREALEEHSLLQQNAKLLQLVNEQNDRLKRLTTDLEERVEARKRTIEEAREKLLSTNDRVEALHRALVAIHRAGSTIEMERLVNDALSGALGLTWTRIVFQSQTLLGVNNTLSEKVISIHKAPLMRGKDVLGQIYFARPQERPFTKDENSFLGQIADAVSLAIDRLNKLEQSEGMKREWEATFDAILEPVSLITSDFTIQRINRAYAARSNAEPEKVIGRKCYDALFGRTSPCEGCALAADLKQGGADFRLKPSRTVDGRNTVFDVFSQRLPFSNEDVFVNMYHDVTEQLRFERQILESAKMAELGTIGSSIAHELNNPLGGMLSFLQLIKMDLKGDEPWYGDIVEMETGARRCRDIVQSLLGFTRKSASDITEVVDLREVLDQALKITELQTRAMGITLVQNVPPAPTGTVADQQIEVLELRGEFNSLAQMLRNFLQNAQEAISERTKSGEKINGQIDVSLKPGDEWLVVEIKDNGTGFDAEMSEHIYDPTYTTKDSNSHPGLGLTVARQIINDHGGKLEIRSTKGLGTTAIISLPRPVFDPKPGF